jgi:NADH-quinone oxidoreductase subunit M
VGEFLMFSGIFGSLVTKFNIWFTVLAGLCIILSAVYTLNMIRKVLYGNTGTMTAEGKDIRVIEKLALGIIVILIFWMGVCPQPVLNLTNDVADAILQKAEVPFLIKK